MHGTGYFSIVEDSLSNFRLANEFTMYCYHRILTSLRIRSIKIVDRNLPFAVSPFVAVRPVMMIKLYSLVAYLITFLLQQTGQ